MRSAVSSSGNGKGCCLASARLAFGEVDGGEGFELGAVGDAGFEIVVVAELDSCVERGLSDEDWKRMSFQKTQIERSDRSLLAEAGASAGLRWG